MAEQTYLDRWQPASFRGVTFLTDSHDAKGGRRLAVHEFPGAELPMVEDLGGKAWEYQLNAYFIGAQYDQDCNDLLAQLNTPGADWLIHPWLGRLWVRAQQWSRQEDSSKNGFCSLSITFVPGGETPYSATPDLVDTAMDKADSLADEALKLFGLETMSIEGVAGFAGIVQGKLDYIRTLISYATLPLTWSQQVMNRIAGTNTMLAELVALPGAYGNALRGITDALGLGTGTETLDSLPRQRLVSSLSRLTIDAATVTSASAALTDSAARVNVLSEAELRSRLLLVSVNQAALADFHTEQERDAVLASVNAAYDVLLPALPDTVFQAAVSARAALIEALLAQDLDPESVHDIITLMPATVLAHRMEVEEPVFIARNNVRHPLFVRGRVYG
jgi:prophage DNA circulation protein